MPSLYGTYGQPALRARKPIGSYSELGKIREDKPGGSYLRKGKAALRDLYHRASITGTPPPITPFRPNPQPGEKFGYVYEGDDTIHMQRGLIKALGAEGHEPHTTEGPYNRDSARLAESVYLHELAHTRDQGNYVPRQQEPEAELWGRMTAERLGVGIPAEQGAYQSEIEKYAKRLKRSGRGVLTDQAQLVGFLE